MAYPESWQEVALLSISNGSSIMNFALITDSFEVQGGEKGIEGKPTVAGGRIAIWSPESDTEFTAKVIPVGVGKTTDTSADGFWQWFQTPSTADNSFPQSVSNTKNRTTVSLAIMWSSTLPSTAFAATSPATASAYRTTLKNAYITKYTKSFSPTDGLSADISIKCPAFAKDGTSNVIEESTDGTGALPAI